MCKLVYKWLRTIDHGKKVRGYFTVVTVQCVKITISNP